MSTCFLGGRILCAITCLALYLGCFSNDEETPVPSIVPQVDEKHDGGFARNDSGVLSFDSGSQSASVPNDGGSGVQGPARIDAGSEAVVQGDSGVIVVEEYLPLSVTSCAALCLSRSENTNGYGGCEFSWLSGDCETRCLEMNVFSTQTQIAFANCTLYDPLCYLDIEQCMWGLRYPLPGTTTITTTFSGAGYNDFNGDTIRIVLDGSADTYSYAPNQVITDGTFQATWDIESNPNASNLFMYYIDVDADGHCDASIDYAGSLHGTLNPNWDVVTLYGEDTYDNNSHAFVCDYID